MDQLNEYYKTWRELPQPRKVKFIKLVAFACYSLSLLLLVIYAFGRTGGRTSTIVPIVLFSDGTPYNLQVIRYLAQRRDVVIGMIVLNSNAIYGGKLLSEPAKVEAILSALKAEGYTKTVPVYGSKTSAESFVSALDQMLSRQVVKFVIVGPCTEAANFLKEYPVRRSNVDHIFVAGGAFNALGDAKYLSSLSTKAEINFFLDSSAADYVLSASHGRPVTLTPIDTTLEWTEDAFASIVSKPPSTSKSVTDVSSGLQWYYQEVDKKRRTTVGLMTAVYATDAQVQQTIVFTSIPVRVKHSSSQEIDGESYRPSSGVPIRVVLRADTGIFFSHLLRVNALSLV